MALDGQEKEAAPSGGDGDGGAVMTFKGRRWTVGTTVTVSIVVAAILMIIVQRWAFQAPKKWDLTSSGINSLGPGTAAVLGSLGEEKIYLTSLYLQTDIETEAQKKYRKAVGDLLRLYQAENPTGVEIDWINPLKEQTKLSQLLDRVRRRGRFESETQAYKDAIRRFEEDVFGPFKEDLHQFGGQLSVIDEGPDMEGRASSAQIERAITSWIELGDKVVEDVRTVEAEPLPRFSAATQSIRTFYDTVGEKIDFVVSTYADEQLQSPLVSRALKDVLGGMKTELQPWVARFEQEQENIQNLPPLGLDELERTLKQNNTVVVESSRGAKAVSFEEMWPLLQEGSFAAAHEFDKRRFAGEGTVTPAILQLVQEKKTALVFVRYAGERLFGVSGFGFNAQQAPLTNLKAELERLNYVVAEWDVKENQAKPTFDTEPACTIYIVLRPGPSMSPQGLRTGESMGPMERAAVLSAVAESGRALFLTGWEMFTSKYEYFEFLSKKWGIDVDGKSLIITALPSAPGEWMLGRSFASVSDVDFRDHALTADLESMGGLTVFPLATPIGIAEEVPEGVTVEQLASVPASEDVWAVEDPQGFVQRFQSRRKIERPDFDTASPFALALVATKNREAAGPEEAAGAEAQEDRIVVLAAGQNVVSDVIAVNNVLTIGRDGKLQVRRQAPGNFTLFSNILHYLDDTLQWLNVGSPLDNSRIAIGDKSLVFWRILAVGILPALAAFCGGLAWYARRR